MTIRLRLQRALGLAALTVAVSVTTAAAQTGLPSATPEQPELPLADRQPQWTARPLFGETDVYVLPKGVAAFVFGLRPTTSASGSTVTESAYRAEFGLPGRFQLGLHATGRTDGREAAVGNIDAQALDIRWALAQWGRVWGNPTVQAEWREASRGADVATVKLLLGDGLAAGWRWGSNVAWTQEASGAREIARAWTAGVSYEGGRFASIGVETRLAFADRLTPDGRTRTAMTREVLAGPSIQIRPTRRLYIDLAPLFGATTASSRSRTTILAGWAF
jgi:hypothetical protein